MPKVEDFSAELVIPELFREICGIAASVGKRCVISTRTPNADDGQADESEQLEQEELVIGAVNFQNTFQLWVHLSSLDMFTNFKLTNPESIELSSDSLAHAFKYEAGVIGSTDIRMKISHKIGRLDSTREDQVEAQGVTGNSRLISFLMSVRQVDGVPTKAIEQRISAECIDSKLAWSEPSLQGISDWADPTIEQLGQMAKVCDQYKHMNDTVLIVISKTGKLTLKAQNNEVSANTSWQVEKAERADESQSIPTNENNDSIDSGDNLFIGENGASSDVDNNECLVLAKDWQTVLQARRMCRRIIIGILHERGLVAYGFLRQGRNYSNQDVATFYLWHQL